MTFEDDLTKILDEKAIDSQIRAQLKQQIMEAFNFSKTPLGRREGATFMTHEASLAGDQVAKGKRPGKNTPKPKTI